MDYHKEMNEVMISVCLPTYNRALLLRRAIASILSQTFTDFELIVVDDGSTDNTKEIVDSFRDARIRYIRHETNKGLMASRNTVLRYARGKYLAFQDSDDWWDKKKLEEEVTILEKAPPTVGAVYSRMEKRYHGGEIALFPPEGMITAGNMLTSFLQGDYIVTLQALLMRRACLETIGVFDERFRAFGDAEFAIRLAAHYKFLYNPHLRVHLEVQSDSISRNKRERLAAREYILTKHRNLFQQHPRALRAWTIALFRAYARQGDWIRALRYAGIYSMSLL